MSEICSLIIAMLKGLLLPLRIDTFTDTKQKGISRYFIEYDGWYFEDVTEGGWKECEVIGNIYENKDLIKE